MDSMSKARIGKKAPDFHCNAIISGMMKGLSRDVYTVRLFAKLASDY
jgi:hypothetical protein